MMFPEPTGERYETSVKRGHAREEYKTLERAEFHTDFGARLFGYLSCIGHEYRYWVYRPI